MRITFHPSFGGKTTDINVLYLNDFHACTLNLDSFKTAYDSFERAHENETNFIFSGGDNFIDQSPNNEIVNPALNEILDASALGNHDLEGKKQFEHLSSLSKFKWLAVNLLLPKEAQLRKNIKKSVILDKNNERVGVIGVAPFDYSKVSFIRKNESAPKIKNFNTTVKLVRKEVEKLEKQGINKIFLLAHTGEKSQDGTDYYGVFSKIGGIDVIIGGHDHKQTDRWEISERNEPVRIVATGRTLFKKFGEDLDTFGELNLAFNKNGVLIKSKTKNKFKRTADYPKTDFISKFIAKEDLERVYHLPKPLISVNPQTEESKVADVIADSNLWYVNSHTKGKKADFAFVNSGTVRANFEHEDITIGDVKKVVPFVTSTLIKTTLTKKQIFDTLNWCVESTNLPKISPGLMQVSGMKYTICRDGRVKDVILTAEDGTEKLKLDELPDDTEFTCVYDTFLATGAAGLKDLKKDFDLHDYAEFFTASRQEALLDYLKNFSDKGIYDVSAERIKKY